MKPTPHTRFLIGSTARLWDVQFFKPDILIAYAEFSPIRQLTADERTQLALPTAASRSATASAIARPPDPDPTETAPDALLHHALMVRYADAIGDDVLAADHRIRRGTLARLLPPAALPDVWARVNDDWTAMINATRRPA